MTNSLSVDNVFGGLRIDGKHCLHHVSEVTHNNPFDSDAPNAAAYKSASGTLRGNKQVFSYRRMGDEVTTCSDSDWAGLQGKSKAIERGRNTLLSHVESKHTQTKVHCEDFAVWGFTFVGTTPSR